ncbi:MAG: hypothetical protein ACE5EX_10210 [Phycisphaerae bacterium]
MTRDDSVGDGEGRGAGAAERREPPDRKKEPIDASSVLDATPAAIPGGATGRWWRSVVVGCAVSLPIGWLLSYAGTLPFLLGPFFFVLFGLMIGAAVHRTASAGRPYRAATLMAGTSVVVVVCWWVSIIMESHDFPTNAALKVSTQTRDIGDQSVEAYRASVAKGIRGFLAERYPPGGVIGYVRWAVGSGQIAPREIAGVPRTIQPRQARGVWVLRAALCVAMLSFGIGSQTQTLRLAREPVVRAIDRRGRIPPEGT